MKFVRRKFFKEFRKAGIPFMAAHRLARLREQSFSGWSVENEMVKECITVEQVVHCDCCGPTQLRLHLKKGKTVTLNWFTLEVDSF